MALVRREPLVREPPRDDALREEDFFALVRRVDFFADVRDEVPREAVLRADDLRAVPRDDVPRDDVPRALRDDDFFADVRVPPRLLLRERPRELELAFLVAIRFSLLGVQTHGEFQ